MILPKLGKLCVNQDFASATAEDSQNVVNIGAIKDVMDDCWLDIETSVVPTSTGTLTIDFVLSDREGLDTNTVSVMRIYIAAVTDYRLAAFADGRPGAHVYGASLPREVRELAEQLNYNYFGLIITPSGGLTVSLNAAISISKPRTRDKAQIVDSNVGIPAHASVGS